MKSLAKHLSLLSLLIVLFPTLVDAASTIYLRDGRVRKGEILEQTQNRIRLAMGNGNVDVFLINAIEKVVREIPIEIDVVHLKNGSTMKGTVIEESKNRLKLRTSDGNIHAYFLDEVQRKVKERDVRYETWRPSQQSPVFTPTTTPTIRRPHKSPGLALALSMLILPGSGQWYNGDTGKGFLFFGVGAVGWGLFLQGVNESIEFDPRTGRTFISDEPSSKAGWGLLMAFTSAIWGGIDAYKSAKGINRERGYSIYFDEDNNRSLGLVLHPVMKPSGDVRGQLSLRMKF